MKAEDCYRLALSDFEQGNYEQALQHCQAGLELHAEADGWHLLALIQRQISGPEAALWALEQALQLEKKTVFYNSLGNLLSEMGQAEQAQKAYLTALDYQADYDLAWLNLARLSEERQDWPQAMTAYHLLLKHQSRHPEALLGMAELLRRQHRWQAAEEYYQQGLQHPHLPHEVQARFWTQWGVLKQDQGELEMAREAHQKALQLAPDLADAWFNLGSIAQELGAFEAAQKHYQRALKIAPSLAEAHLNQALLDLAAENWSKGFAGLAWRKLCLDWHGQFAQPAWQGETLQGKTLLVESEYGQGDILLFLRFLRALPTAKVLLRCSAGLKPLIDQQPGIKALLPQESAKWDLAVPLFDVPHLLQTTPLDQGPPYLSLSETPQETRSQACRIGFCWHGQPPEQHPLPTAQRMAARKSLPLRGFAECAARFPEIQFLSLQWPAESERLSVFPQLGDLSPLIHNWLDTARLMQNLDLVISADTAVAHLAGAMNLPVWVLLPSPSYWFWPAQGKHFAWYPQMRLFRQKTPGEWGSVFAEVQSALSEWLRENQKN